MCNITSASFRVPALWSDGALMHHPARPLRLDNVAEALKCRGIRNASAPHRVQPVSRKAAKLDEAPPTKRRTAPAQLPPPVQLNIVDPKLLAQIKDAMELLTTARVLEHLMRGPHHNGIKLLPAEVAVFEQPSSAWPVAMLKQLDEVRLTGVAC
ncbi:hypothetical protein QJQ45_028156 [Haematococcus lacustris]|nr:hypothetical protein QJQ45_028156 [Haematococcus lacustris]